MYQDESGFGRISGIKGVWTPKGGRPEVPSHKIRDYRYAYGAIDAHTGDNFFIIADHCNTEWMQKFLDELPAYYSEDYIIWVMDNASWHKANKLHIPENIEFVFIPPYTPEMNPIEQVWSLTRRLGFHNQCFNTLEDVIDKLCLVMKNLPKEIVKTIAYRNWLPILFGFRKGISKLV